jgi:hypothetical protein
LGVDDPQVNPFARAKMPCLANLLGGKGFLAGELPVEGTRASLYALDACLSVDGLPQSATGQATLLTGRNIPAAVGYHYGPKPNPEVAGYLKDGTLFSRLQKQGRQAALLNAYPKRYFESIRSGRRLYSAIPLAVTSAGISLFTEVELYDGKAISADITGQGWRERLGYADIPVLEPRQAGQRLAHLGQAYDLAFFEYWATDYAGHGQDMKVAVSLLESFDQVLEGLVEAWDDQRGVILLTSDHGNLEDLSTRRHTANPVPLLIIGTLEARKAFGNNIHDLTDVAHIILEAITNSHMA